MLFVTLFYVSIQKPNSGSKMKNFEEYYRRVYGSVCTVYLWACEAFIVQTNIMADHPNGADSLTLNSKILFLFSTCYGSIS